VIAAPKMDVAPNVTLPERGRGRLSPARQAEYEAEVAQFCDHILETRSRFDFAVPDDIGDATRAIAVLSTAIENPTTQDLVLERLLTLLVHDLSKEKFGNFIEVQKKRFHEEYTPVDLKIHKPAAPGVIPAQI
jgi:hypothetical protein